MACAKSMSIIKLAWCHIGTSVWTCLNEFFLNTLVIIFLDCYIKECVLLLCFGNTSIIELIFSDNDGSCGIKLNIICCIFLTFCDVGLIIWVCYTCLSLISLIFLEIGILVFNLRDEHIFSDFEHSEWCHFIILIYRFNQSWKVFQFIDVRLHVLWVRVDQLLQLIFSFVDLIEDLILVSWLKFIG